MTETTDLRALVEEMERLDKEATPGPWLRIGDFVYALQLDPDGSGDQINRWSCEVHRDNGDQGAPEEERVAVAALITEARNALPAILSALREAWERAERAEARVVDLATLFGIPDGARYLNDCRERAAALREAWERAEKAEARIRAVEELADEFETWDLLIADATADRLRAALKEGK